MTDKDSAQHNAYAKLGSDVPYAGRGAYDTDQLGTEIAEIVHYLTDDSDILSSGIRGTIDRLVVLFHSHTKAIEREAYLVRSDLAWCLGKLRGLGHPAEHLEDKYDLRQQQEEK